MFEWKHPSRIRHRVVGPWAPAVLLALARVGRGRPVLAPLRARTTAVAARAASLAWVLERVLQLALLPRPRSDRAEREFRCVAAQQVVKSGLAARSSLSKT